MARSRANITLYPRRYKFVFYVPFKWLYFISLFLRIKTQFQKHKMLLFCTKAKWEIFKVNNIKNFLKIFFLHLIFNLIYVCWFCTRYIKFETFQKLISLWLPCWLLDLSLFTYAQVYFLTCKVMCYSCYSLIHKMVTVLNKNLIQGF
jgi:hypothetical protein